MVFPTDAVAVMLVAVSGYALYHSQNSIPKLQKYEKNAEKAAEWSNEAEKRLWDTRYTVGAGFVATLLSLLSATAYTLFVAKGFGFWRIGWPVLLGGGLHFTSRYMRNFWGDKAKVPMMDEYNDAISDSMNVLGLLDVLAAGWGAVAVLKLVAL